MVRSLISSTVQCRYLNINSVLSLGLNVTVFVAGSNYSEDDEGDSEDSLEGGSQDGR